MSVVDDLKRGGGGMNLGRMSDWPKMYETGVRIDKISNCCGHLSPGLNMAIQFSHTRDFQLRNLLPQERSTLALQTSPLSANFFGTSITRILKYSQQFFPSVSYVLHASYPLSR